VKSSSRSYPVLGRLVVDTVRRRDRVSCAAVEQGWAWNNADFVKVEMRKRTMRLLTMLDELNETSIDEHLISIEWTNVGMRLSFDCSLNRRVNK
jgi:hypothetical protein